VGYFHFETAGDRDDLAQRVKGRVQITTEALGTYVNVIEDAKNGFS
jgi:hypothetical protein